MPSLVSTAEVIARCAAAGQLDEGALQGIIDANEVLIRNRVTVRDDDSVSIRRRGGGTVILLPYRMAEITEVLEHWLYADPLDDVTLDESDWQLSPDGTAIERRIDGPHPSDGYFADEVIINGSATSQMALIKNVLIQLCAADVNGTASAGLKRQRLGDYEEEKSDSAQNGPTRQKEEILAQLGLPLPVFS